MNQKKTAGSGLLSLLGRLAFFALCGYLLFSLATNAIDITVKKQQIALLEQQIAQQQTETMELRRLMESSDNINEYYEKIAREKLDYTYPDERVFVDITGK